ncbi:hypothetical protein M2146_000354 [Lachnospiraceae bacterium PF1-22]|uniref:zinc ribbon domain-containing protein n=1 Tax=Ohessyouella blattaphilus TaxID=2949333 RepID=UPI003E2CC512
MFCSNCGKEYEGKFCPECGNANVSNIQANNSAPNNNMQANGGTNMPYATPSPQTNQLNNPQKNKPKKPLFKRWWFWVLLVLVIGIIVPSLGGDTEESEPKKETESVEKDTEENTTTKDETTVESDTKSEGITTQYGSLADTFEALGTIEDMPYTISPKAKDFISKNETLFPTTSKEEAINHVDFTIPYKGIAKNQNNFGDKLIAVENAQVIEIYEENISDDLFFTTINLMDTEGNSYYMYYFGKLEDVYTDEIVNAYGAPMGLSVYETLDGGSNQTLMLAGSYVEVIQ